jgi:hypothetical protein
VPRAESALRSPRGVGATLGVVATNPTTAGKGESFLLELLTFAGWRLQLLRRGNPTTIRATRGDVVLVVTETSLPGAAGVVFARAMRSGRAART